MKRTCAAAVWAVAVTIVAHADMSLNGAVAVQGTKKCKDATEHNIDNIFVRGELKAAGSTESKLSGLVHLRSQANFGEEAVKFTIRQAFFQLPVSIVSLRIGRWYEIYTVGQHFGMYLFGVSPLGSGSMVTNYTVLDGLRLQAPLIKKYNTDLHLALIGNSATLEDARVMVRVSSSPLEMLSFDIGASIHAAAIGDEQHRLTVNATYTIVKELMLLGEYGITDLSAIADNSWILAGIQVPTLGILDMCRVEVEFKKDRLQEEDATGDVAWMIVLMKKIAGLQFNCNVGADPNTLGSRTAKDIGIHMRVTAKF